ncbi:MAG: VWA domain-containing protein [Planctomycetota bacterium]|nr:VWA domain-containing protein [Planctomycetota bacterium]
MDDFDIDNIDRLKWLLLVAGCSAVFIYGFAQKSRALRVFADANLVDSLTPDVSRRRQVFKSVLLLAAMAAIVLALVGPRWGRYFAKVQKKQLDIIVCLDVSRSMLAKDAGMARLDRAKDDIKQLLDVLSGGMVGLVAFAGAADLACPLTDDYEFVRLVLNDVHIHSAPMGGTDMGAAIEAGVKAFSRVGRQHRVILLLTDGEDHGGRGREAAAKAHEQGIQIYAIGIGNAERGALVPVMKDGRESYLMHEGQQLWSKLDPTTLDEIARAGGGEYHPSAQVTGTQRTLEWLYSEKIAPTLQLTADDRKVRRLYPRFHWLAALALGLLLLESMVGERKSAIAPMRGK